MIHLRKLIHIGLVGVGLSVLSLSAGFGQTAITQSLVQQVNEYRQNASQEKLFVHTDRTFYLAGEMIWFKVYSLDGIAHTPLSLSKIVYLEILNKDRSPVLQAKIAMETGSGHGSFYLPATLESGNYIVRAYTNWMKNVGPEWFFEKPVTIVNTFRSLDLKPLDELQAFDVQFFPEGGHLVSRLESKVAFKATGTDGKGIACTGAVINQNNDTLVRFEPLRFGIGHFLFTPDPGQSYRAVVKAANGTVRTFAMPTAQSQGLVMRLHTLADDQVRITVQGVRDTAVDLPNEVYLLAHTRQEVKVAEGAPMRKGVATFTVKKSLLGEGITHFTVFNSEKRPLCERLYFQRPRQKLAIDSKADKNEYATRSKVTLEIRTGSTDGKPLDADLSLAVFRTDSLQPVQQDEILSYVWLSSDLRGVVESPAYYLNNSDSLANAALDNLMLTHGWRRFRWEELISGKKKTYTYVPEHGGHIVWGRVFNSVTNKPAKDILTYLSSPGPEIHLYGFRSNDSGQVQFELRDYYGPRDLIMQTNPQRDSTYRFEIFNPFSDEPSTYPLPVFNLTETVQDQLVSRSIHMQVQNIHYLNKKNQFIPHRASYSSFYSNPDKVYFLDDYTRFQVMEEVMREYVQPVLVRKRRGKFHFMVLDVPRKAVFQEDPMILLDGVPVFDTDKIMAFDPLKVKRLDVFSRKYLYGPMTFHGLVSYATYAGDLGGFQVDPRSLLVEYEGPQLHRDFFAPRYETTAQQQSRLPDFRNLLYWVPDLKTSVQGTKQLDFYTSDQPGKYLVVVQGIGKQGLAGSHFFTFDVKRPL